jgi:class 3 adenylate cyclase/TolB-like protein
MQANQVSNQTDPMRTQRAQYAVVVVDVVESVRLMRRAEAWTIGRWRMFVHRVRRDLLPLHGGQLVKSLGDGLMLIFETVPAAVAAAFDMQRLTAEPDYVDGELAMRIRIAVHFAEVVVDDLDIYGSGVNLAARILGVANQGDVVISAEVRDALADGLQGHLVNLGDCHLKHWEVPVRVFRLLPIESAGGSALLPAIFLDLRPSIAVVPFSSRDGSGAAWGDAIAESIVMSLSGNVALRVVSLLSTRVFRHSVPEPEQLRRRLGVAYLVTGSYVESAGRVQVDVQLCSTGDGEIRWAARRHADGRGLFAGDDPTMGEVASRISFEIVRVEVRRARALPLVNLESYTLYLGGVYMLHRLSRGDFERARELLEHLAERYPRNAAPHAMLSKWHVLQAVQGWAPDRRDAGRSARASALRALDLEPDNALALSMQAIVVAQVDGDLQLARQLGEAAVSADPQESHGWLNLGGIHSYLGHAEEAAAMPQRAIELSPMDPARFAFDAFLAEGFLTARRFDGSIAAARRSIRLNAMHATSHRILIIALALDGRIDEARRSVPDLLRLDPSFSVDAYRRGYAGRDLPHFEERLEALRACGVSG